MKDSFLVRPLKKYDNPSYPKASVALGVERCTDDGPHPLVQLVSILLVVGIALLFVGCYLRTDYIPEDHESEVDGGPDGDPPLDPLETESCDDEGEIRCLDSDWYAQCLDDHWVEGSCDTYCVNSGYEYSTGCIDGNPSPCQCDYDYVDGGAPYIDECDIGDAPLCLDEDLIQYCSYGQLIATSCDLYCNDMDPSSVSQGCDVTANDCICVVPVSEDCDTDLGPACLDDDTLRHCQNSEWVVQSCNEYCVERYGLDAESGGCDIEAEDPCLCAVALDS